MPKSDGSVIVDTRVNTQGMTAGIGRIEGSVTKLGTAFTKLGRIIATVFAVRQIVAFSRECIELGSNIDEVQNVVDVTFGEMAGVVEDFAKTAATQFGLSELAAKQYTSTIGAMYKSMGFSEKAATGMSIEMAKLAADMASFYNLDADVAFQKIRSGISGETEPLKQLGINLSEANLEEFRLAQGIETAYKNMDQQNKALLRYNYLLSVTKDAQGDFSRTSESWANQTRILHLQLQSIKADLGAGLINVLTPVLQVINKLLQGLARVASAFKAFTALITGKKADTKNTGMAAMKEDLSAATDSAEEYADATETVADATKKANKANKQYLSGLDEIRRFDEGIESASSASPASSKNKKAASTPVPAALDVPVDFGQLEQGDTVVDKLAEKLKTLFDQIKQGVEPVIQSLNRLWNEGLSKLGSFTFQALMDFYNNFLVPVGQWVFGDGIPSFVDALNNGLMAVNWSAINTGLQNLWNALAPFAVHVGEGLLWFWENVLVPLGTWYANEVVPRFLETVATVVQTLDAILVAAQPGFQWFWDHVLLPIAQWTGGIFLTIWDGINSALKAFAQWCQDNPQVIENITTFVVAFFTALAGIAVVTQIWTMITAIGQLIGTIGTIVGALNPVTLAIAAAIAIGVLLWKNWDTIKAKAIEIWGRIKTNIINTWNSIKNTATRLWDKIKTTVTTVWSGLQERAKEIFEAIAIKLSGVWSSIKTTAEKLWTAIKTNVLLAWSALQEKAKEIFEGIAIKLSGVWNSIKTTAETLWNAIKKFVEDTWDGISTKAGTIFEGIGTAISDVWTSVQTTAGQIWAKIQSALETVWGLIKDAVSNPFDTIKTTISDAWDAIKETASETWEAIKATLTVAWSLISEAVSDPFGTIKTTISDAWDAIKETAGEKWEAIKKKLIGDNSPLMKIKEGIEGVAGKIQSAFVDAFNNIAIFIISPINGIIDGINAMIEGVVDGINTVIDTLNLLSFSLPDWLPGALAGKKFGLNIPRITSYPVIGKIPVPQLAAGAVIPPNAPFMAMLGDQRSGTNIEAPLSTIQQAVRDVVGSGDINLTINIDGRTVFANVLKHGRIQQQVSGVNPFAL